MPHADAASRRTNLRIPASWSSETGWSSCKRSVVGETPSPCATRSGASLTADGIPARTSRPATSRTRPEAEAVDVGLDEAELELDEAEL